MPNTITNTLSLPKFVIFNWRLNINLKIFWILSFVSILGFSVFYIFQVNNYAREVLLIEKYQQEIARLIPNNEILEINLARSGSLENIENYFQSQNFEKAKQVKYIQILESSIAKNK